MLTTYMYVNCVVCGVFPFVTYWLKRLRNKLYINILIYIDKNKTAIIWNNLNIFECNEHNLIVNKKHINIYYIQDKSYKIITIK